MGPIADLWGIPLSKGGSVVDVIKRFNVIRGDVKALTCPNNDFTAAYFGGPNAGPGRMVSYNTSRYMMFERGSTSNGIYTYSNVHQEQLPARWSPRVTRMGDTGRKVFVADGARFSHSGQAPDYDLAPLASWGGTFSDVAPYKYDPARDIGTKSWDRGYLFDRTGVDARFYAFRHALSAPISGGPANSFKLNVGFFDGHVELMGDLDAGNPWMWLPAGSKLGLENVYPDVLTKFGIESAGTIDINS
jgi:prepilin-type processing-associated H-X9-DG protein